MRINNWESNIIIIVIMSPAIPVRLTRGTQMIYTDIQADIKSPCKRRLTQHTKTPRDVYKHFSCAARHPVYRTGRDMSWAGKK